MTAAVTVVLDTRPPVLAAEPLARPEPPEPWTVVLKANEDLGACGATYIDALDEVHSVGVERLSARALRVVLPTSRTLDGTLHVIARDLACNAATVALPVKMLRPPPVHAVLDLTHAADVEVLMDSGMDVTLDFGRVLEADLTLDHATESTLGLGRAVDVTLEVTDG